LDIPEKHRQAALTVFQNITDAWHILGDKAQREQYDREREGVGLTQEWPIMAEMDVEEVQFNKDEESYSWPCKCSGLYTLNRGEVEEGCNVVCCSNCSLSVHISNHARLKILLATSN
jgi:hypothetical protein